MKNTVAKSNHWAIYGTLWTTVPFIFSSLFSPREVLVLKPAKTSVYPRSSPLVTFRAEERRSKVFFKVVFMNFWAHGWNLTLLPTKWKLSEQYFPVVLLIVLYKVVLTFESVDEILKCDHSSESYWAVLSCGAVIVLHKVILTFECVDKNCAVWQFKWKPLLSSTFLWCCLLCCTRWF